jgi:hypothetical protein
MIPNFSRARSRGLTNLTTVTNRPLAHKPREFGARKPMKTGGKNQELRVPGIICFWASEAAHE